MEWLLSFCESPDCSNLLFALLHSLWQGALIAALLYLFFRTESPKGENARYNASLIAMAAVVLCVLFTFSILNFRSDATTKTNAFDGVKQQENIAAVESLKNIVQAESIEVQSVSEKPSKTSASSTRKADFEWKPLALTVWLIGVVIMLLRAMYLIAGGAKLRTGCNALKDERILAVVESLRERMKITRKIRVAVSDQISIPGVIGFVRSVLFLPASMLSGMPADALEAILAHELAHIKRYDYLVNFCQMVVEAMLFFNPAVWWISRQIRIEREVCCDNAGIETIGRRIRYAEVLVGWAEKLKHPDMELSMAAMGFGTPDSNGSMTERIKRILTTDHKPALKAPWHIAGMTLLLSFIAIGCLWMGADVTVVVAGKILTPEERIDRITEISQGYGDDRNYRFPGDEEDEENQIFFTVKTWDAKPLPESTSINIKTKRNNGYTSRGFDISTNGPFAANGTFNGKIDYGTVYIFINAEGYALAEAGPFRAEPGENIEGLEFVLQKGNPAIKVVDDNDDPVENVTITGEREGENPYVFLKTDANGIARIDNTTNIEASLAFDADGFELYDATDFILKPDEMKVIKLTPAKEAKGIVVSKTKGEPVEGAKLSIVESWNTLGNFNGSVPRGETVTDESGSFRLQKLRSDHLYCILVEAEGFRSQYLNDVKAGMDEIVAELGPEKSIKGKITGDLETLKKDENDTPVVIYRQIYVYGGRHVRNVLHDSPEKANVKIENGSGYFEVEKCLGQAVQISSGDRIFTVDLDEDDLDNVLIDLSPEDTRTREVILKFEVPEDGPDIEGNVRLTFFTNAIEWNPRQSVMEMIIIDNQARIEIPAPGEFHASIDINNENRSVGYWFNSLIHVDIPDGEEPYILEIPVYPAGAIYGTIRRSDGTIIEDAQIYVEAKRNIIGYGWGPLGGAINSGTDKGTFNATPLPLDSKYCIIAFEDRSFGVSEIIKISEKNPIVNIDIDVPEGLDIHGRLVDADGNPVRLPVDIATEIKRDKIYYSHSGPEIWPDKDGRFVFENVNPGPYGKCAIVVKGAEGYQHAEHEIIDFSEQILIQLKKGLRATGVVIDEDTGLPIPEVEVRAYRRINQNGHEISESIEAEEATNEKGEFVLTCMSEGAYRLILSSVGYYVDSNHEITGGQDEPSYFKFHRVKAQ